MNVQPLSPMLITSSRDRNTLAPMMIQFLPKQLEAVEFFEPQDKYEPTFFAKVWQRLNRGRRVAKMNKDVMRLIESSSFKSFWVFKGMNLYPKTIAAIKSKGILLFNYNADNPLEYSWSGSGNRRVIDSYKLYDAHFTYSHEIHRQLLEHSPNTPVFVVPFGHNVSDAVYQQMEGQDEILRCCFIGNPDDQRASFLVGLLDRGIELDVYGANWGKYMQPNPRLRVFKQCLGHQYLVVLRQYRVQLNLFRPHNRNSHNMRTFEGPAVGGIMLAPRSVEHDHFFKGNEESFYFDSLDEAAEQCQRLLSLGPAQARAIRRAARDRSVASGYSYRDRVTEVLRGMLEIVGTKS